MGEGGGSQDGRIDLEQHAFKGSLGGSRSGLELEGLQAWGEEKRGH